MYVSVQNHKSFDIAIEVQRKCFSVLVTNISWDLLILLWILQLSFQIVFLARCQYLKPVLRSGSIFFKKVKSSDDYI